MSHRLVGSETQAYEREASVSGYPRVMRETHATLTEELGPHDVSVVPVHTRDASGEAPGARSAYLQEDPVLRLPTRAVEDVDAVLVLGLTLNTDFGRILRERRQRALPVVAMVHDVLPLQHPEWFLPRAREHYQVYLQQLLRVSDHVVVPTEAVRRGLTGLGWRIAGEIHVVPLGSTFSQRPPTSAPKDTLSLLYVSTVAPRKGHRLLLDTFAELRSRGEPVTLTLIGRQGWMAEDLAAEIREHPEFGRALWWRTDASDDDVVAAAGRSRVAVVPAEDEGFGLVLEEALTMGLSCVCRDIPVFRERQYPNLTFAEGTPEAMADAIVAAASRPAEPLAPGTIRSMADFGRDLSALVLSVLP